MKACKGCGNRKPLSEFYRVCGSRNAQAHHDDYSRPLDVTWLCPSCHAAEHVAGRNIERSLLSA